ncbi:MAG: aconitate hydratase AcnA [Acidobacteria bacterium]|nr:aconitate hydratase AcnA [Acidobacteriota bacterium]MBI3656257.1 aconitate hydratase AcnA [Acidobacteriota bacterium]
MLASLDSFKCRASLAVGGRSFDIFRIAALESAGVGDVSRLPFSLKVLLENLLRHEDGRFVTRATITALAGRRAGDKSAQEIAIMPARVLLQDFTGVPAVVDLAAMRAAIQRLGGDPRRINPRQPAELVIDHSVQVDRFGEPTAFAYNAEVEFARNRERYAFLRWGQTAFRNFKAVPPDTGIVHQVNLEYLARVVFTEETNGSRLAYPDTLVGTDSHTTMINGLGVVGWGVGGIEAEAAMLGQPLSMLIPEVVGFKLFGALPEGTTATDAVLTVTQILRKKGVVGKFVEFYGSGLSHLSLADRATIANMAPEYGATVGFFPVDAETLNYLRCTARSAELIQLVEAYTRAQGLFREDNTPEPIFSDRLELDLSTVESSLAGPKRPQDRVPLRQSKTLFRRDLLAMLHGSASPSRADSIGRWIRDGGRPEAAPAELLQSDYIGQPAPAVALQLDGAGGELRHGSVVISAITSCTNTSNPAVMLAAGLLAKKAVARGLKTKPWVKTSLAPGSKVVTDYLKATGLMPFLEALRFHLVGYGCTTCIGNSGPLPEAVTAAIKKGELVATAVLSGNRNFEGRINPMVRANYLASPPLVVAYAVAGSMDIDLYNEPLGHDTDGQPVYLREIWPSQAEVKEALQQSARPEMFLKAYADVFQGDDHWQSLAVPAGDLYQWDPGSTYIKNPPYFDGMTKTPVPLTDILGARVLARLGDSVTTDHISPAGSIDAAGPAGQYLLAHGVTEKDFNSYGARRGNHEVMVRGTFANLRLRNQLAPDTEGGWTLHLPSREKKTIFEAAMKYQQENVPLIIIAGKEYGTGSSRDWAAKGPRLLGVRAAIAESFERIHRTNLVAMGILPLQFMPGENRDGLGLTGFESFDLLGITVGLQPGKKITIHAVGDDGVRKTFTAIARVDTPEEVEYYRHGGILPYVLRQLL